MPPVRPASRSAEVFFIFVVRVVEEDNELLDSATVYA